jgi:Protein of unknown function (DUF3455)
MGFGGRASSKLVRAIVVALAASLTATSLVNGDELPESIRAPGETALLTVHAEGAQIYQCQRGPDGKLAWRFREPIATLFRDGETVGRHYAGPQWELNDGSRVQGKVNAKAPGATASDIPWLKLDVVSHSGAGALDEAATIQRIDTQGGVLEGECETAGAFRSVEYAADYVFLRK